MQDTQLRFAKDYLDTQRKASLDVGGQKVKLSDLVTSERGNGILFDRSVHEGIGGARKVLADVTHDYLKAHPGAKLSEEPVRAAIEDSYIDRMSSTKDLKDRCTNIAKRTSAVRDSYAD